MSTMIGPGTDRVDGPAKVRGAAANPSDVTYPGLAHAVLVRSTIPAGRIVAIDDTSARVAPGVLTVITHDTAPKLLRGPMTLLGPAPPPPLQDDRVLHHGQYVAVVVAETPHQASAASRLISVSYEPSAPVLAIEDPRGELRENPWGADTQRGDVDAGIAAAEITLEANYTTAANTNNPIGLFSTVAVWDGDTVTVHDCTQWTSNVQATIAQVFAIDPAAVRVHAPYVGGAFGAGLRVWPHVILTILAARQVARPVKTVLTRPEMFTGVGHRPSTKQTIRLGAQRDGRLVALEHTSIHPIAMADESVEPITAGSVASYACPNLATHDMERRLNIPPPGWMRAPGEAQGNFALESAIDELAYRLSIDPVDLRLRNYTDVHPESGLPWASKALRVLRSGRRPVRVVAPESRRWLDARRPLADRLRRRRRQLQLVAGPLRSTGDHHPRRLRVQRCQ